MPDTTDSVKTEQKTVPFSEFPEIIKPFKKIMVGVDGGIEPFRFTYFNVSKREVKATVLFQQAEVTYSIMRNSEVSKALPDVLYIHRLRLTLLEKQAKNKVKIMPCPNCGSDDVGFSWRHETMQCNKCKKFYP